MKLYTATCALLIACGATAMAADPEGLGHYKATFTGSTEGYVCNQTANGAVMTQGNGHLVVEMTINNADAVANEGADPKWRADIKVENPGVDINVADDHVLAIKLIGDAPQGATFRTELKAGGAWISGDSGNQWKFDGSFVNASGNYVYYVDYGRRESFSELEGDLALNQIHLIVADLVTDDPAPSYTVDWIATFSSVEAVEAAVDWLDDGAYDADDQEITEWPDVYNVTTDTYYSSLQDALDEAAAGACIWIGIDADITARTIKNIKNFVIEGVGDGRPTITRQAYNKEHFTLGAESGSASHFYRNLTFANEESKLNVYYFNIKNGCSMTMEDVVMKEIINRNSAVQTGSIINLNTNGTLNLVNTKFQDCEKSGGYDIFCAGKLNITGNCGGTTVYVDPETAVITYTDDADNLPVNPVVLYLNDPTSALHGVTLVTGTTNADYFIIGDYGYGLAANAEGDGLMIVEDWNALTTVNAADAAAEAVYYNLQGMRIDSPVAGQVYVKTQGGKAVKVVL